MIELVDVVFNVGAAVPEQKGLITAKVVVTFGVTVTEAVVGVAQAPAVGVNTYEPEVVLLIVAGAHVPVIEFVDVVANVGAVDPSQIADEIEKVGVTIGLTV